MPSWRNPVTGVLTGLARGRVRSLAIGAMAGLAVTLTVVPPWGASAGADGSAQGGTPALGTLLPSQPLPGFTAERGVSDGPLTAAAFAAQSSRPAEAEDQFRTLAAEPGFAAFTRLWVDRAGSGTAARDIAELLFRIPDLHAARQFTAALSHSFASAAGVTGFATPGVPGGVGYSVSVRGAVEVTEQIVVMRIGPYVAMLQFASTPATAESPPLTPAQAVSVSRRQYLALSAAQSSVSGSAAPSRVVGGTPAADAGPFTPVLIAVAAAALLLLVAVGVVLQRRRRPAAETQDGPDPFGADGALAAFGAIIPPTTVAPPGHDPWAVVTTPIRPRPVPFLGGDAAEEAADDGPVDQPVRVPTSLTAPQ